MAARLGGSRVLLPSLPGLPFGLRPVAPPSPQRRKRKMLICCLPRASPPHQGSTPLSAVHVDSPCFVSSASLLRSSPCSFPRGEQGAAAKKTASRERQARLGTMATEEHQIPGYVPGALPRSLRTPRACIKLQKPMPGIQPRPSGAYTAVAQAPWLPLPVALFAFGSAAEAIDMLPLLHDCLSGTGQRRTGTPPPSADGALRPAARQARRRG